MKRAAERQIVKDGEDEDDIEEVDSPQGFKKAEDTVLANRKIRALPRRSVASGGSAPVINGASTPETPPPSKFASFGGFGSPTSASTPFSFTPSNSSILPQAASSSIFNASAPSPSPVTSASPVSAHASNAAKAFATFLTPSAPSQPTGVNADVPMPSSSDDRSSKLYSTIRSLNSGLLASLTKAFAQDPFVDFVDILDEYKARLLDAQKDSGTASKSTSQVSQPPSHPLKPQATMPSVPTSFAGFGSLSFSSTSQSSSTGGFSPSFGAKPAPSFGSTMTPSLGSVSSQPDSSKTEADSKPAPLSFGAPSVPTSKPPTSAFGSSAPAAANPFAPSKPSSTTPFTFGTGSSAKPDTNTTTASLFGTPSSTPTFFGASTTSSSDKPASNPFAFGSSSTSTTNAFGSGGFSGSTSNTTPPKSSPFGFGSGFGKSPGSGSIGNPVGFGFGTPPRTPDAAGASGSAPSASGFTFSSNSPFSVGASEKKSEAPTAGGDGDGSREGSAMSGTPGPEGDADHSQLLASKNPNDEEGEGEEDEETVHAIKIKAYKLNKKDPQDGGGSSWGELGHGILRLKKHKETGARRLLLRNSSTGKININFRLYNGLKPTLGKKSVTFVGHDDGAGVTYTVRTGNDDLARELRDILDREIEFVKSKAE
ncbi:hypothetical protein HGRIS_002482 [Hohenbuehelia grisea]|uniref:RanBD1 domain-containing protein n=1 Tax=Hohenbuehelia grisea TaxID=104357 RepID=A0ABR3JKK9_9AGAR